MRVVRADHRHPNIFLKWRNWASPPQKFQTHWAKLHFWGITEHISAISSPQLFRTYPSLVITLHECGDAFGAIIPLRAIFKVKNWVKWEKLRENLVRWQFVTWEMLSGKKVSSPLWVSHGVVRRGNKLLFFRFLAKLSLKQRLKWFITRFGDLIFHT